MTSILFKWDIPKLLELKVPLASLNSNPAALSANHRLQTTKVQTSTWSCVF